MFCIILVLEWFVPNHFGIRAKYPQIGAKNPPNFVSKIQKLWFPLLPLISYSTPILKKRKNTQALSTSSLRSLFLHALASPAQQQTQKIEKCSRFFDLLFKNLPPLSQQSNPCLCLLRHSVPLKVIFTRVSQYCATTVALSLSSLRRTNDDLFPSFVLCHRSSPCQQVALSA